MSEGTIAVILAVGAVLLVVVFWFAGWGVLHATMELGQYAGAYDWEPTWAASLFGTLVGGAINRLFRRIKS